MEGESENDVNSIGRGNENAMHGMKKGHDVSSITCTRHGRYVSSVLVRDPPHPPNPHTLPRRHTVLVQVTWPRSANTRKVTRVKDGCIAVPFPVL